MTCWSEAAALLAPDRRELVESTARRVACEAQAYTGDWVDFSPFISSGLTLGEQTAAMVFIRDNLPQALPSPLQEAWDVERLTRAVRYLQCAQVSDQGVTLGQVLDRSLDESFEPRMSPDGKNVAFIRLINGDHKLWRIEELPTRLYVMPIGSSAPPREVADYVGRFPDWSPDGQYVVFARTANWPLDDQLVLGTISRRQVCGADGLLLQEFHDVYDLAGVVFQRDFKVRCTADGRIIFVTMDVHLPATVGDMPEELLMFAIHPQRSPTVTRLISRNSEEKVPAYAYAFELSPDGRFASLPGESGIVDILDLSRGYTARVMQPFNVPKEILMTPAWKSGDELCCLGPPEAGSTRRTVKLLKIDFPMATVTQVLSTNWPTSMARGLLEPWTTPEDGVPTTQESQ